jgi:hypothetical protein
MEICDAVIFFSDKEEAHAVARSTHETDAATGMC